MVQASITPLELSEKIYMRSCKFVTKDKDFVMGWKTSKEGNKIIHEVELVSRNSFKRYTFKNSVKLKVKISEYFQKMLSGATA